MKVEVEVWFKNREKLEFVGNFDNPNNEDPEKLCERLIAGDLDIMRTKNAQNVFMSYGSMVINACEIAAIKYTPYTE